MDDTCLARDDKLLVTRQGEIFYIDHNGELVKAVYHYQPDVRQLAGGYLFFEYWDDEAQRMRRAVAALVIAEAFLLNPGQAKFITYKNGNPRCVRLDNIEWRQKERQTKGTRKNEQALLAGVW